MFTLSYLELDHDLLVFYLIKFSFKYEAKTTTKDFKEFIVFSIVILNVNDEVILCNL